MADAENTVGLEMMFSRWLEKNEPSLSKNFGDFWWIFEDAQFVCKKGNETYPVGYCPEHPDARLDTYLSDIGTIRMKCPTNTHKPEKPRCQAHDSKMDYYLVGNCQNLLREHLIKRITAPIAKGETKNYVVRGTNFYIAFANLKSINKIEQRLSSSAIGELNRLAELGNEYVMKLPPKGWSSLSVFTKQLENFKLKDALDSFLLERYELFDKNGWLERRPFYVGSKKYQLTTVPSEVILEAKIYDLEQNPY